MNIVSKLIDLPNSFRRLLLIKLDIFLLLISCTITYIILFPSEGIADLLSQKIINILFFTLIGILIYFFSGQYKGITRYLGSLDLYMLVIKNVILCIILYIMSKIFLFGDINFKFLFILNLSLTSLSGFSRFAIRDILSTYNLNKNLKPKVAIYGAGEAGIKLFSTLRYSDKVNVVAFLDDSKNLQKRRINNITIYEPKKIDELPFKVDQIFLAIPSARRERVRDILEFLKQFSIPVFKIPSIDEITSGKLKIDNLSPITVEDLLGRELTMPDMNLMSKAIEESSVCITGAAGSIGTELSMQILNLNPKKVIIYDNNEKNLYFLGLEIEKVNPDVPYKLILADATDYNFLKKVFLINKIDVVFHAAAYKHVPIVENNPISGIYNNVFSTYFICKVSKELGIKRFTLISSDKAVRPKNVMGATKRLAELIVQGFAKMNEKDSEDKSNSTIFSMVRFGNVLGSSGSVVPKFQSQINNGQTLTLTHPDVVRYFMSISEAVQLVIQSSALAKGGEVFLLDMGEPILIKDIAEQLILLSGKTIKSENNLQGDIEIKITGLRPGEKLHEELLINSESMPTKNPLIYIDKAESVIDEDFWQEVNNLEKLIKDNCLEKEILIILSKLIPEWQVSNFLKKRIQMKSH